MSEIGNIYVKINPILLKSDEPLEILEYLKSMEDINNINIYFKVKNLDTLEQKINETGVLGYDEIELEFVDLDDEILKKKIN